MSDQTQYFLIDANFLKPEGFIERLRRELAIFRQLIRTEPKENVKDALNAFQFAVINANLPENIALQSNLLFLDTLGFYAQQYSSKETFQNILNTFENSPVKDKFFSKFPVLSKMIYAENLFKYYSLIKTDEPLFSFEKTDLLIKAKAYLWKIYINHIDKKNVISNLELSHVLSILSISLAELSRWFEPLHYLNTAKGQLKNNPNIEYLQAIVLNSLKDKTCIEYNTQLLLRIIDSCMDSKKQVKIETPQKNQLSDIEKKCRQFLYSKKIKLKSLRSHKRRVANSALKYNSYRKFCLENQLFLNEHSFFCNCSLALRDTISIETNHAHTKIAWVKPFEELINLFTYDFVVAREAFYDSLDQTKIPQVRLRDIGRKEPITGVKNALLKNSFKTLYSILDQIAQGIFEVMGIDPKIKLETKYPNEKERPKIYFLNMWDLELFEDSHFLENFYLISLYSITKDLDHSKYASLKEFRTIRNSMEHKSLIIKDGKTVSEELQGEFYSKENLLEKTKILMALTKSAILSFTYLVRRQSKIRMENLGITEAAHSNL